MNRLRISRKEVIRAAAVLFAVVAWVPSTSRAQASFLKRITSGATLIIPPLPPVPAPGIVTPVDDFVTETNTFDTALSLTVTSDGAQYTPNTPFISSFDQGLFSGINPQNDTDLLPVTEGLPCDSYTPMVNDIAPALMRTYEAAIANTQQLESELEGEDFTPISLNIQAPYLLTVAQGIGQAVLAGNEEMQLLRAQMAELTLVIATDKLHQLDATVRPLMPRQGAGC